MKRILFLLMLAMPCLLHAQKMPDDGFDKVTIVEGGKTIKAETMAVSGDIKVKTDRFYFWYAANMIHSTQGGFSGKLLNGLYSEFYPNKNLKKQGTFKEGLKDGAWKSWNEDGALVKVVTWKNGIIAPEDKRPFWKKLNIFKRRDTTQAQKPD